MSETVPATAAPAAVDAPAPAPAPVVTPVVAEAVAPAVAAPEAAPQPAAPEAPPAPETVLGDALKPAEPAPVVPPEGQAPAEPAKVEGQSDDPAPPPTYDDFVLPDGAPVAAEQIGAFTGLLGEFESLTKADHAAVQQFGQKMVDFHVAEVQRGVQAIYQQQQEAWQAQRLAWKDAFLQDPEIGGNRFQTTVDSAIQFIRTHGGNDEQQAEFRQLMETSGLGNHPAMIRLLAKAGAAMSEGQPLAASSPAPSIASKTERLYGPRKG